MKYMVMECHTSYAVVLAEDGRFLKVANLRYQVGQSVTQVVQMQSPQPAAKPKRKWVYSLAAMAACMVLVFTSLWQVGQMPVGSVFLTINPEVRLDVSRSDRVVDVEGLNVDGQDLLDGYDYKRKDLQQVTDELVDRAIDMGYLHEGGQITVTLDGKDEAWVTATGDTLETHLNDYLTEKISVTVEVESPAAENQAAENQQIVIPVTPEASAADTPYGDDDYGETVTPVVPSDDGQSDYGTTDDGQTDYGTQDDGRFNYEAPDDNGQSNYEVPDDDGQSNYEAPDDGQSNYGSSNYGQSGYEMDD